MHAEIAWGLQCWMHSSTYTTCPGERVSAVIKFNVTFLFLKHYYEKMCRPTWLWKDAENLTTYDCVLWCSLIVHIRPYPLNTTIAFYFVIEWSNISVFVRLRACRATTHLYFTWPWPVLDLASYSAVVLYQVLQVSEH